MTILELTICTSSSLYLFHQNLPIPLLLETISLLSVFAVFVHLFWNLCPFKPRIKESSSSILYYLGLPHSFQLQQDSFPGFYGYNLGVSLRVLDLCAILEFHLTGAKIRAKKEKERGKNNQDSPTHTLVHQVSFSWFI